MGMPLTHKEKPSIESLVTNKEAIASHNFLPLIQIEKLEKRYRRISDHDEKKRGKKKTYKPRQLLMAAHIDANVYSFYSKQLADQYELKLDELGLRSEVTAYRSIPIDPKVETSKNRSTIHFAKEVFDQINSRGKSIAVLALDIKNFFPSLDHKWLKHAWKYVLDEPISLPDDHFNVYKSVIRFSYVRAIDIFKVFQNELIAERNLFKKDKYFRTKAVKRYAHIRNHRVVSFCDVRKVNELRKLGLINANKFERDEEHLVLTKRKRGIPQGLPISSILANIYMLPFDLMAKDLVSPHGMYRRYSDDMVFVCEQGQEDILLETVNQLLDEMGLMQSNKKKQLFYFEPAENGCMACKSKIGDEKSFRTGRAFEYLGLQWDGNKILIKNGSLAKYYAKMFKSVNKGKFLTKYAKNNTRGEFFKAFRYRRYTFLGARRKMKYQEKASRTGKRAVPTFEYDWGNFITYAFKANNVVGDNRIKQQIGRHFKILQRIMPGNATNAETVNKFIDNAENQAS